MPFERWLQKVISRHHNSMFYSKIDDHGVRLGDMGRILARWRRPVASRVALDLPYWAMHFFLAKHKDTNIPIMMEQFAPPAAWF